MFGMFDKDKLFAPEGQLRNWVDDDQEFILREIEYKGEIETNDGPTDKAAMVWLYVSPLDVPDKIDIVSMVGDYAKGKAEERQKAMGDGNDELPAVVVTQHVESSVSGGNDAYVFTFKREYLKGDGAKAKAKD